MYGIRCKNVPARAPVLSVCAAQRGRGLPDLRPPAEPDGGALGRGRHGAVLQRPLRRPPGAASRRRALNPGRDAYFALLFITMQDFRYELERLVTVETFS